MARRIFVPQPGVEPVSPAVEARSSSHWTAREFLAQFYVSIILKCPYPSIPFMASETLF